MKFRQLRGQYQKLVFDNWQVNQVTDQTEITYYYQLVGSNNLKFEHKLSFPNDKSLSQYQNILFQIGLIEAINYYKLACPEVIEIKCGFLDDQQKQFWQKLYYQGLGEFIYLNQLHQPEVAGFELNQTNLVQFVTAKQPQYSTINSQGQGNLIPVGGGKDSVVSLELLKNEDNLPLIMSGPKAAYDCLKVANYQNYFE